MTYKLFHQLFVQEMSQTVNGENSFPSQLLMIRENLRHNSTVISLAPTVHKTQNGAQVTYWVGDPTAQNVQLIVNTSTHGNFRKVELTGKNPEIAQGSPPWASDLYVTIKNDSGADNLVFTGDEFLSDSGTKLWSRLVSLGYKIAVYDNSVNKYVLTQLASAGELSQYIGGADRRKYVFVMAESVENIRGVMHTFDIMELKRNAGYPLFENLK